MREVMAHSVHAISQRVTFEPIGPAELMIIVFAGLPFAVSDGSRLRCGDSTTDASHREQIPCLHDWSPLKLWLIKTARRPVRPGRPPSLTTREEASQLVAKTATVFSMTCSRAWHSRASSLSSCPPQLHRPLHNYLLGWIAEEDREVEPKARSATSDESEQTRGCESSQRPRECHQALPLTST
jgi:hypothetical protein